MTTTLKRPVRAGVVLRDYLETLIAERDPAEQVLARPEAQGDEQLRRYLRSGDPGAAMLARLTAAAIEADRIRAAMFAPRRRGEGER